MKTKVMKAAYATFVMLFFYGSMFAQSVGINDNGSTPNANAMLDVSSTTKGFLPPRMTNAEKTAIVNPPAGMIVWCSNCGASGQLLVYDGAAWVNLTVGALLLPGAPTIGTATAGNTQATVTFTAPASDGGVTITSYKATSNPGNITGTLTQAESGKIIVNGLTNGTAYTFTVTATNAAGTGPASAVSNSVTPVALSIGQSYGGGIIAYILQSGDPVYVAGENHGLIAATADQIGYALWGCQETSIVTSTAIGAGQANTTAIVNGCNEADIAARICYDLVLNGYSDWFLPSKDELNKLYLNRVAIGGFVDTRWYWSSSEYDASNAWYQHFGDGSQEYFYKYNANKVRAVRAF
ncbi:MAG: DUF1566 domain-containing protein [Bacteroidetes bacterium]|nr:DUF1566 domain-containing protein [Bacteroidota bacterium]